MAPPFNISFSTTALFGHWALSRRNLQRDIVCEFGLDGLDIDLDSRASSDAAERDDESSTSSKHSFIQFAQDIIFDESDADAGDHCLLFSGAEDTDDEEFNEHVPRFRSPNMFGYSFGDFMNCTYYNKFLKPEVRQRIYIQSRNRDSTFRSHFRVPLKMVDNITDLFISRGWVSETKRVRGDAFYIRTQLLIMCCLEHLATRRPFRQFETVTNLSPTFVSKFFTFFLDRLVESKEDWISYPKTMEELQPVMKDYEAHHLPGCGGSIDVVHCKWASCAAGDRVKAKGKEGFPTLAFECVTNNQRKILGISCVQFGTRNDQHIVRLDNTVDSIRHDWYKDVEWQYFDLAGNVHSSKGIYLICDGGYLRWRTLICPYQHAHVASRHGYFSSNLESVRKDVECTFGILKKRWRILEFGMHYRSIMKCEQIFITCCILHNMFIEDVTKQEWNAATIGKGYPDAGEAIYIEGPSNRAEREIVGRKLRRMEKLEARDWAHRRDMLSSHLWYRKDN